jgi:hypothetical protein
MRRLLFLLSLCAIAQAQATPECGSNTFTFTTAAAGAQIGNLGNVRCTTWTLTYYADAASALSIQFETSPDLAGAPTGTWTAIPSGSITFGTNPSTTATQAFIVAQTYAPWIRVNLTSLTGTSVAVKVDGSRGLNAAPTGGGGGGGSVTVLGNAAVLSGQQAVTATAAALPSNPSKTVCVASSINNSILVYVGPAAITTATGFFLAPGQSTCQPLSNTNLLSVVASTTGATVAWISTN